MQYIDLATGLLPSSNAVLDVSGLVYTYKARGALELVLKGISDGHRNKVLLPAFNCPSVVQTVLRCGLEPDFYAIDESLNPETGNIRASIDERTLAVLAIHYFGFEADLSGVVEACTEMGIRLIEDWSHSFLQASPTRLSGSTGDYAIYSFWKIVPTTVGGAARTMGHDVLTVSLAPAPWKGLVEHLRGTVRWPWEAMDFSGAEACQEPNGKLPPDPLLDNGQRYQAWYKEEDGDFRTRMPWWALRFLKCADLDEVVERRRSNYRQYLDVFSGMEGFEPVFSHLPDDVCPWAFPVYCTNRDRRAPMLRASGIPLYTFGETLHPLQVKEYGMHPDTCESVKRLIEECLCLPLHQDIGSEMIEAYGEIARAVLEKDE